MRLMLVAAVAFLTGCVLIYPMVEIGPNQYRFEAEWRGSDAPDHKAKDVATKKCASLGKTVAEMSVQMRNDDFHGEHYATVKFDCH